MNKLPYYLSLSLMLFFTASKAFSQVNSEKEIVTVNSDTTHLSVKGDLQVLTQRIFTDFTAYITGSSKLYNNRDKPMVLVYRENGKLDPIMDDEIRKPLDSVESIEVVYAPRTLPALYGSTSLTCVIKIKFKE